MKQRTRSLTFVVGACAILSQGASCGSASGTSGTSGTGGTGGTSSSSTTTGTGTGGSGTGGSGSTCPGNLAAAPNSEFCANEATIPDCNLINANYDTQVCGVAVLKPMAELARSPSVMEFAGSGPPDLGCFAPAGYPVAGASQTVQMSGTVKIFSHGCESRDVTIEVFKVKRTGGADEADLDGLVGTAVVTPSGCQATGVATANMDCGIRYECKYAYDGVPSETELVIRTKGAFWAPLVDYNIYIPTAEVKGGVWTHDVRALASDDLAAISQAAIGAPITSGKGAVAGEVHDCGDVRLIGATVGTDVQSAGRVIYFTNDEAHPLPDLSATSTTKLGLYAAFDIAPGPVSVGALGLVGGKVTTVGYFRARVFADSVTAVTFHGVRPFQIK
jgi:hypothetical protein